MLARSRLPEKQKAIYPSLCWREKRRVKSKEGQRRKNKDMERKGKRGVKGKEDERPGEGICILPPPGYTVPLLYRGE